MTRFVRDNGLTATVFLAVPLLFLVISTVMGGLAPDATCPSCVGHGKVPAIESDLTGDARIAQRVARWIEHVEAIAPNLTSEQIRFAWEPKVPPDDGAAPPTSLRIATDDLSARYAFAIPVVILILAGLPIALTAALLLARASRVWKITAMAVAVLAIIGGIAHQDSHPVRLFAAEYLLAKAALDESYGYLTEHTWLLAFWTVDTASVIGLLAAGQLLVVLAWLARRRLDGHADTDIAKQTLVRRARAFKIALVLGSVVLVLSVATAHGLLHWSSALLAPESAGAVQDLAAAAGLYWGVMYSLALLALSLPAAIAIHLDMKQFASDTGTARQELTDAAGFAFDLRQSLAALSTIAAPALTGPVLELVKAVSV